MLVVTLWVQQEGSEMMAKLYVYLLLCNGFSSLRLCCFIPFYASVDIIDSTHSQKSEAIAECLKKRGSAVMEVLMFS